MDNESVDENLQVAQAYASGSKADKAAARTEVRERVGLPGSPKCKVYELSGGERRLAVARLLLKPRDLVLADEPTGSLDPDNRDVVLGLLRGIANDGAAVLHVTHDDVVAESCDRVVHLGTGVGPATSTPVAAIASIGV